MNPSFKTRLLSFGLLRIGLLSLGLLTMLLPVLESLLGTGNTVSDGRSAFDVSANLISPVLAPLLIVVILFDIIMSRVRAADEPAEIGLKFRNIARIELVMIGIMLLYWIPFFISITR